MADRTRWVYGRPREPASPGVRRVAAPAHPPLSERQEWFKDLKFGMFVHWGIESLEMPHTASGAPPLPWADPSRTAEALGPRLERLGEAFDPNAWLDLAQRAGQRYLCFTTRHHLGFANFAGPKSDYNATARGPHRDFLRAVSEACRRRGMPLFAYLSLPDLSHPDFRPLEEAAWGRYRDSLLRESEQLATEYAPLAGFWLDPGPWNGPAYRYPVAEIAEMVRSRPGRVPRRSRAGFPGMLVSGRDWDGAEQSYDRRCFLDGEGQVLCCDLFPPGSGPQPDAWPFEVCDTLNNSWFFNPADRNYKDVPALIRRLVEVVGRGGNYLLNMGPPASGALNPEDVQRLDGVGQWLGRSGEAIYGTRPLGTPAQPWGWPLLKGDLAYLHILNWPGGRLGLPGLRRAVAEAHWLDGPPLDVEPAADGVLLHLPADPPDPVDSIAVLGLR